MTTIEKLSEIFEQQKDSILKDYFELLRFKSVSAEAEYDQDCIACCDWLNRYLTTSGLSVEKIDTPAHPILIAQWQHPDPSKPTVLLYGHYDVQPVDPINLWLTPPFEPAVRNGKVFARGAQDNKGQLFFTISALRYCLADSGSLPVSIKIILDGDEEHGSEGLAAVLPKIADKLKADHLVIADVSTDALDDPTVTVGIRGLVTMTVEVEGSNSDLHSGVYGGVAYNPNRALVEMLSTLHDTEGRITIPGFYDSVVTPSDEELAAIKQNLDKEFLKENLELDVAGGEQSFAPHFWNTLRPTLEINGIGGGYSGSGFKTVIPAKAIAKLSARLVPNQEPLQIGELIATHLKRIAPKCVRVKTTIHPGVGKALRTSPSSKLAQAAAQAYSEVNGAKCGFVLDGASIPITPELMAASGADVVLLGYGLSTDKIHAPNEHFSLECFQRGFVTMPRILEILGK